MRRLVLVLAILGLLLPPTTALAVPPEVVIDNERVAESEPSRADGYLVFNLFTQRRGRAVLDPDAGPRVRLNRDGTSSGSSTIDGTTVAFDEFRRQQGSIRFYDVMTQEFSPSPLLNTRNFESDPSLSGDWIMIYRTNVTRVPARRAWQRLILVNLQTEESRTLVDVRWRPWYLETDQVNGDWATYETCRTRRGEFSDCQVFLYQISTGTTSMIPNPGAQQYTGAVTDDGTVYFGRGGGADVWRCGRNVRLFRKPLGGPAVRIATLPAGYDVTNAMFAFDEGSSVDLYFSRLDCAGETLGIYRVPNADTATD